MHIVRMKERDDDVQTTAAPVPQTVSVAYSDRARNNTFLAFTLAGGSDHARRFPDRSTIMLLGVHI